MKNLGLAFFTDTYLTVIGLLIFFCAFIVLIVLQSRQYSGEVGHEIAHLPLERDSYEPR